MNWDSITALLQVSSAYVFLCLIMPAICLYHLVKGKGLVFRFFFYIIISNLYITIVVYILGYLKIFNIFTISLTILIVPILLRLFFRRKKDKIFFQKEAQDFNQLLSGEYGFRLYLRAKINQLLNAVKKKLSIMFKGRVIESLILLALMVFVTLFFGYYKLSHYSYGFTDEETHLYWIQSLIAGNIFPAGIYPHALHNILATISMLFNITVTRVVLLFSITSTLLIMTALYMVIRSLFANRYAALIGFMIFILYDAFNYYAYVRYQFMFPMEYGMVAMMAMIYAVIIYIKKPERITLILFSASIAITFSVHFYVTIVCGFICIAIGLTYFIKIIKKKILLPLIISAVIGLIVGAMPLAAGYVIGYPLERSIYWGLEIINSDIEFDDPVAEYDKTVNVNENEENKVENHIKLIQTLQSDNLIDNMTNSKLDYYGLLILEGILFLSGIVGLIFSKNKDRYLIYILMAIIWLVTYYFYISGFLGLTEIIDTRRALVFLAYFSTPLLIIPFELIYRLLKKIKLSTKGNEMIMIAFLILITSFVVKENKVKQYRVYWTTQSEVAMELCLHLVENESHINWTVVSTTNELSALWGVGQHYELVDLVEQIDEWTEEQSIVIPTKYVYFVIEKYSLRYFLRNIDDSDKLKYLSYVDEKYVLEALPESDFNRSRLYYTSREEIMSKAYFWAKEYIKYYPHEMSVYYEDEEIIVYKLVQNTYALNNLSINYKEGLEIQSNE